LREENMRGQETPGQRLKKLRLADRRNLTTAADAAREMGVNVTTYQGHENDSRGLTRRTLQPYAKFYGSTVEYLLTGRGIEKRSQVPVVGHIGSGQEFKPVERGKRGEYLEFVDPPSGIDEGLHAAKIVGDSMHPLMDGWLIFFYEEPAENIKEGLGKLCLVHKRDGTALVKFVHKGSAPGRYNLVSWNAPLIPDVEIESVHPIAHIVPVYD
jgi:transcriptional regulator with XRE-family HTH domain